MPKLLFRLYRYCNNYVQANMLWRKRRHFIDETAMRPPSRRTSSNKKRGIAPPSRPHHAVRRLIRSTEYDPSRRQSRRRHASGLRAEARDARDFVLYDRRDTGTTGASGMPESLYRPSIVRSPERSHSLISRRKTAYPYRGA